MKRWMALGAMVLVATVGVVAVGQTQDESAGAADRLGDTPSMMTADIGHAPMDAMGGGPGRRGGRGEMSEDGDACGMGGPRGMGGMMGFGRHHGEPPLEALVHLGLTDAQRGKLKDLHEQRIRAAIPIRADLELAELDLEKLLRADRPDPDAVSRQVDRIADLRGSLMKNHVTGMVEARAILTPAQHKKLMDLRHEGPDRPMSRGRGR